MITYAVWTDFKSTVRVIRGDDEIPDDLYEIYVGTRTAAYAIARDERKDQAERLTPAYQDMMRRAYERERQAACLAWGDEMDEAPDWAQQATCTTKSNHYDYHH